MKIETTTGKIGKLALAALVSLCIATLAPARNPDALDGRSSVSLGALLDQGLVKHRQAWGVLGVDVAAADPTRAPALPLRVGDEVFPRGIGHHAGGEITVDLAGQYTRLRGRVGVQWQGGGRGSVVFRVEVDGRTAARIGPRSDSDPTCELDVSLVGARRLRLIADDTGDGIGCDMANWIDVRLLRDPRAPGFGAARLLFQEKVARQASSSASGIHIVADGPGLQAAVAPAAGRLSLSMARGEEAQLVIPFHAPEGPVRILARAASIAGPGDGPGAEVALSLEGGERAAARPGWRAVELEVARDGPATQTAIVLTTSARLARSEVRWWDLRCRIGEREIAIPLILEARGTEKLPPPRLPDLHPAIARELVEWDWRLQDGIGTAREPRTWRDAILETLDRADARRDALRRDSALPAAVDDEWTVLHDEVALLDSESSLDEIGWETLWRRVHAARRRLLLGDPLAVTGPLVFIQRVPSIFSHQLTQYYGKCARPGGGVFVLEDPGRSMRCRSLTESFPPGSYQHLDVSHDGERILFAFCETPTPPRDWQSHPERHYNIFELRADGSGVRQLTDGPHDDFSPRYLPDGRIVFLSTRRGGFHRCGRGPCETYTLALMEADGAAPRVISYHETNEWDPVVLNDGRILYTRWDYVDRHAVFYQQLWTVRPDGSGVQSYYGNNTLNPVGIWEARPIPGSSRVIATAGAHHAMTAGSIIRLDVSRGIDGPEPITRLTPDVRFPESESPVGSWHAPAAVVDPPPMPTPEKRWPGHCYRSPCPLSEDLFLAAYSFDPLRGEPLANRPNLFGLYLVDRFGNKELLYRNPNIGSVWPTPLRARASPPALASRLEPTGENEGTFFLEDVYHAWPSLPDPVSDRITRLRILQLLPKSTPHINQPRLGLANASPGRHVLGTVPVEADGSAYFRAPAGMPIAFQALDRLGRAVQTMRSATYLQPGETASCVGCHEHRSSTPRSERPALAARRPPSEIAPAPDGSKPLSYPRLVQPVLDRHCVRCHSGDEAPGGIALVGEPAGSFSVSYLALAPRVPFSEWKGTPAANGEPMTRPSSFGARASRLLDLLLEGHEDVELSAADLERLVTWMDANALFYGTFDPADQQRQQRGERIDGPAIE